MDYTERGDSEEQNEVVAANGGEGIVEDDDSEHFQKGIITADLIDGIRQNDDEGRLRVKVYQLSDTGTWNDQGTGYLITEMRTPGPSLRLFPPPSLQNASTLHGVTNYIGNSEIVSSNLPGTPPKRLTVKRDTPIPSDDGEKRDNKLLSPVPFKGDLVDGDAVSQLETALQAPHEDTKVLVENELQISTVLPSLAGNPDDQLRVQNESVETSWVAGDQRLSGDQLSPTVWPASEGCVLMFTVKAEDSDKILVPETNTTQIKFEKQGGTILTWVVKRGDLEIDLALSFEKEEDFGLVWDMIEAQRDHLTVIDSPVSKEFSETLPIPTLASIQEILDVICNHSLLHRESIVSRACTDQWLVALKRCFVDAEALEQYNIVETIWLIVTKLLSFGLGSCTSWWMSPIRICDTICLLEYPPSRKEKTVEHKEHRDFLMQHTAHILPDIEYPDDNCYDLINHTYRLQYLKDTVLYGQLSELALSPMQHALTSNYQTIFCCLLKDEHFIKNVLNNIREGASSKDALVEQNVKIYIDFIVELVARASPMISMRTEFLRKFEDKGLYEVLTLALSPPEVTPTSRYKLWLAIVELFTGFIGRIPYIDPLDGFRTYICNWIQSQNFETNLLERLTYAFTLEEEINRGLTNQIYHLLTTLLKCFESPLEIHHDDVMFSEVMEYFLKDLAPLVLAVINREWSTESKQSMKTSVHQKIFCIELFISLVSHQETHIVEFVRSRPVIESIAGLIVAAPHPTPAVAGDNVNSSYLPDENKKYTALIITAVRFLKACILKTSDPIFTKCIASHKLLNPVIECFIANQPRDNLMSATCRALLEAIIMNNIVSLVATIALNDYDNRENLDNLTQDIFEKMKKLHTKNETRESLSDHGTLQEQPLTQIVPLPRPSLPVNSAWQKCEAQEERFFSEDEKENDAAPQALELPREFQPPKRNAEPENELDLLSHRVPKEEIGQPLSSKSPETSRSLSQNSPSNPANLKGKGIISFKFKTKRKRFFVVNDGTKKKKPRGGSSECLLSDIS